MQSYIFELSSWILFLSFLYITTTDNTSKSSVYTTRANKCSHNKSYFFLFIYLVKNKVVDEIVPVNCVFFFRKGLKKCMSTVVSVSSTEFMDIDKSALVISSGKKTLFTGNMEWWIHRHQKKAIRNVEKENQFTNDNVYTIVLLNVITDLYRYYTCNTITLDLTI
jgi:hypothetical protein